MGKFKAHIVYKNSEGKRVPGVTTITGELGWSKGTLINWANRMGLEGTDTKLYVDDKAAIGTLAHLMITNKLQGKKTTTSDYSKNQITAAKNSVKSFNAWLKEHTLEPILIEKPLVSELLNFGGTCDIYGKLDGALELIDLKTGSGIYDEHIVQVGGGYAALLTDHGYEFKQCRILNIPRGKGEKFDERIIKSTNVPMKIFLNCLENYKLHKELKEA